ETSPPPRRDRRPRCRDDRDRTRSLPFLTCQRSIADDGPYKTLDLDPVGLGGAVQGQSIDEENPARMSIGRPMLQREIAHVALTDRGTAALHDDGDGNLAL